MDNVADIYPLTPVQEGMLFHTAAQPGSGVYVEQYSCVIEGPLRVALFQEAWQHAVERHPALRTVFLWEDLDEPLQIVRDVVSLNWDMRDWQEAKPANQVRRWQNFLTDDRTRGFDLSRAPLMRMALFKTEADTHRFAWSFHHLLLDGWSVINVLDEVWTDYAALCKGERASIASPRPFRDYVAWHRSRDLDVEEEYWSELLHDVERPTPLHIDQDSTDEEGRAEYTLDLSVEQSTAARDFAREHRITLNTLIQGAWALLLSRYSGSDDVVYGTTVAGRPSTLQGVESMVGSFINTVPMRIEVAPGATPARWLQEVQSTLSTVQSHAHTPLSKVQQWSPVQQGQALFDSLLVFENHPKRQHNPAHEAGLGLHDEAFRGQSNYPLALLVHPRKRLRFTAVYDAARFRTSRIERLLGHLSRLLSDLAGGAVDQLVACSMLTTDERRAPLPHSPAAAHGTSQVIGDASEDDSAAVHRLIARAAARTPEAVAVYFEDQGLTYGDLEAQANALAGSLVARGVAPGDHVGLFVERTPAMLIGILGIMKAGAAYLPLDPTYPADRLQYMIDDAAAPFVVTTRSLIEQAPGGNGAAGNSRTRLCLEDLLDEDAALPSTVPVDPEDPAYIMYTSGSTGTPKGVVVTHANLAFSTWARHNYYAESPDRFLLVSPFGFDSSVAGLFWTLTTGGALVLPRSGEERDLQRLGTLIHRHEVSHLLSVPSLYSLLLEHVPIDQLASLRTVIVAGEACSSALPSLHDERLPATDLYNEYGPTEATVWATVHAVQAETSYASVPIGRPIPGAHAYVLDHHQRLVSQGVPGELYIGGPGVASGYLNRPEQTAERFVSPPFDTGEGPIDGRLYRTGDRVRALEGGVLEFLGRTDHQIKVQGYRIEPAEIQAALHKHPAVRDAVVVARSRRAEQPTRSVARHSDEGDFPSSNETRLVAYVTAHVDTEGALEPSDLRTFLETKLPPPMVPAVYVPMEELPRLPSGKVDREALPAPDAAAYTTSQSFVAPRTPDEETLANLWADALDVDTVGIHDNFFDLGGHSLLAIRLIGRVRERFQVDLPIQALFDAPTIAGMAEHVRTLQWATEQPNRSHDAESDREEIEL